MIDEQFLKWLYSDIDEAIDFEYKEECSMGDLISRKALMRKLFFTEDGRKYPTRDINNFPTTISLENLQKIIKDSEGVFQI